MATTPTSGLPRGVDRMQPRRERADRSEGRPRKFRHWSLSEVIPWPEGRATRTGGNLVAWLLYDDLTAASEGRRDISSSEFKSASNVVADQLDGRLHDCFFWFLVETSDSETPVAPTQCFGS